MNPMDGASTIHSLMKLRLKDDYNTGEQVLVPSSRFDAKDENSDNAIEYPSVIVVDEASMCTLSLFNYLRDNYRGKVLFVGDNKQLPPVGEKESPVFTMGITTSILDIVKRQALGNSILSLATKFREGMDTGIVPHIIQKLNGTEGIRVVSRCEFRRLIVSAFSSASFKNDEDGEYAKVMAWRNKTAISYNRLIRKEAFGFETDLPMPGEVYICNSAIVKKVIGVDLVETDGVIFKNEDPLTIISSEQVEHMGVTCFKLKVEDYPGDLYMILDQDQYKLQRENLAKIAKGLGYQLDRMKDTTSLEYKDKKKEKSKAWFNFFNIAKELSDIRPPYAVTTHKSQGSDYEVGFVDYGDIMLDRDFNEMMRLMYVSITRCKTQCIITW